LPRYEGVIARTLRPDAVTRPPRCLADRSVAASRRRRLRNRAQAKKRNHDATLTVFPLNARAALALGTGNLP
jgi:hypothetical protein